MSPATLLDVSGCDLDVDYQTFGEFAAINDEEDVAIVAALQPGESYTFGGGASAEFPVKVVVIDLDTLTALRAYRKVARVEVADQDGEGWLDWTELLSTDWSSAGPRLINGDSRDWPPLQRLRNERGPAILPFLDGLLDEGAA